MKSSYTLVRKLTIAERAAYDMFLPVFQDKMIKVLQARLEGMKERGNDQLGTQGIGLAFENAKLDLEDAQNLHTMEPHVGSDMEPSEWLEVLYLEDFDSRPSVTLPNGREYVPVHSTELYKGERNNPNIIDPDKSLLKVDIPIKDYVANTYQGVFNSRHLRFHAVDGDWETLVDPSKLPDALK